MLKHIFVLFSETLNCELSEKWQSIVFKKSSLFISEQLFVTYVSAIHRQKAPGSCNIQVYFVIRSKFELMRQQLE